MPPHRLKFKLRGRIRAALASNPDLATASRLVIAILVTVATLLPFYAAMSAGATAATSLVSVSTATFGAQ